MKKIISFVSFIFVVLSAAAFAESDGKNWFEREFGHLEADVKKVYYDMFSDASMKAAQARADITATANDLAASIESGASEVERNKYIAALSAEIVAATQDTKTFYMSMAQKAGNLTDKFTKMLYGDVDDDSEIVEKSAKLFSEDSYKVIYKLLDDADTKTADKKRITADYKAQLKDADVTLQNAYRMYSGFYLSGVTKGQAYDKAKKDFSDAVTSLVTLASNIYAKELAKLTPKEKSRVATERKEMMDKQAAKIQTWIQEQKTTNVKK